MQLGEQAEKDNRSKFQPLLDLTPRARQPIVFNSPATVLEQWNTENNTAANITNEIKNILGQNIALFDHADFKELCKELPVIARNNLDK